MVTSALVRGTLNTLQDAQTTGNGTVVVIPPNVSNHTFYIIGTAGVSAGAVTIETAADPDYAGTWQTCAAAVTITAGAVKTVELSNKSYTAVRARISTTVTGTNGNVTVVYIGN